jgi:hypothetical protein
MRIFIHKVGQRGLIKSCRNIVLTYYGLGLFVAPEVFNSFIFEGEEK